MTDFQVKQMNNNLKDISMQLRNINRSLEYIDKRLAAIDTTLEKNGFTVLHTVTTTDDDVNVTEVVPL